MTTSGTRFEQGEIVLVPFPFTDLTSIKQRPVLVLSNARYNQRTEDIVTCGITSNVKNEEYSVMIENKDLVEGNLPAASRIKVDKLFTLQQSLVEKKIARIKKEKFEEVQKELMRLTVWHV